MKKNLTLFAAASFAIISVASCSKKDEFVGSWQAKNPTDITKQVPAAASASSLISISFSPAINGQGDVTIASIIDATQSVDETPDLISPYEVDVAATATISGKWSYESGDDDDLLLTLDPSTFNVNVDSSGVSFRQNIVTDTQQPVTDSLTAVTVNLWKQQFTSVMPNEFNRFGRIEDVKVKTDRAGNKILKLEIENPEQTLVFRSAE